MHLKHNYDHKGNYIETTFCEGMNFTNTFSVKLIVDYKKTQEKIIENSYAEYKTWWTRLKKFLFPLLYFYDEIQEHAEKMDEQLREQVGGQIIRTRNYIKREI